MRILSLNQNGVIVSLPDSDGNVVVQVGIMKVTVPIDTIEKAKSEAQVKTQKSAKTVMKNKSRSVKNEIDLRGKDLEEASYEVDKYLDDAYLSGLKEVSIIHGKGTGVLRKGIGQMLKSHRHVRTSRLGGFREGGDGVTIVEIK